MFWRFSQRLSGETTKVLECFRTVYKMPENGDIFPRSTLAEPSVLFLRLSLAFFQPGVDPLGEKENQTQLTQENSNLNFVVNTKTTTLTEHQNCS